MGAAALLLAAFLAAYPALAAGRLLPLAVALGAMGIVAAGLCVLRSGRVLGAGSSRTAGAALFLLAAEYGTVQLSRGMGTSGTVIYPGLLVILCELLYWAAELSRQAVVDRAVVAGKILLVGLSGAAGMMAALFCVGALGLAPLGAVPGVLLGSAAATGLLLVFLVLARRASHRR